MARVGLALLVLLAVGLRVWRTRAWTYTFNGDEAILGLMARHVASGELSWYFWGQSYLGSLDALLAAPFLSLLGPSVLALRLPSILVFGALLVVQARLLRPAIGFRATALALLFLALPSTTFLDFSSQTQQTFVSLGLLGTASLTLALRGRRSAIRLLLFGVLVGLGLWLKQVMAVYLVAALAVWLLDSAEWRALRATAGLPEKAWLLVPPALAALVLAGFFADGCGTPVLPQVVVPAARIAIGLAALALAVGLLVLSARRTTLIRSGATMLLGATAGYAPALAACWQTGQPPGPGSVASCPYGLPWRAALMAWELAPRMVGYDIESPLAATSWYRAAVIVAATIAIGLFARGQRRALADLALCRPGGDGSPVLHAFAILLLANLFLSVASANTVDRSSTRYLLPAWQAFGVLAAVGLARWLIPGARASGPAPWLVGGARAFVAAPWLVGGARAFVAAPWLVAGARAFVAAGVALALVGPPLAAALATRSIGPWSADRVERLVGYLETRGATRGYADYWLAYPLDFLSGERLVLAPFTGIPRYAPYEVAAGRAAITSYVLEPDLLPLGVVGLDAAIDPLSRADLAGGPIRADALERLRHQVVIERATVAGWDVIIARENGAAR